MGVSKAIKDEEERSEALMHKINNLGLVNNYMGYKLHKARADFIRNQKQQNTLPEPKPLIDIEEETKNFGGKTKVNTDREPDLDDYFERQKLASLKSLLDHQQRAEKDFPLYAERQNKKTKKHKKKPLDSEQQLERQFQRMQDRRKQLIINREEELNQRSLDLIRAHEVDIRGIECLSILGDKESSVGESIDAFCSYKMVRYQKKIQNFLRIAKGKDPVAYIGNDDFIPYHFISAMGKKMFANPVQNVYNNIGRYQNK
mmetsp:Transcript_31875/g.28224  ORF Transcript_31875/g.28224 Transcript_31875/m.28224 type:complete len:258 (-) Transcript_31875:25-798(-)